MTVPRARRIGNIAQLGEVLTKPPGIIELLFYFYACRGMEMRTATTVRISLRTAVADFSGSLCRSQRATQNLADNAIRIARGEPGEMFVLLSALTKYILSNRFSTFA